MTTDLKPPPCYKKHGSKDPPLQTQEWPASLRTSGQAEGGHYKTLELPQGSKTRPALQMADPFLRQGKLKFGHYMPG
jgi:hypothetical protein